VSGHPTNTGLGRALASRRQIQSIAIWRPAANGSGQALLASSVLALIYVPSGAPALEALAELMRGSCQQRRMSKKAMSCA
jgi:hypothetical protein